MKLQLPDMTKVELSNDISIEEKVKIVEELTNEWMPVIISNWNSNSVKFFLDSLSNYLVWHKEDREEGKQGKEDKYILSKKKLDKLSNHRKNSKTVNFSDLSSEQRELLFGEVRGAE